MSRSATSVVGVGDRVNHLFGREIGRSRDDGDEVDQHTVAHDLGFESGRAVGIPDRLRSRGQDDADPHPLNTHVVEMGEDIPFAKLSDYIFRFIFKHLHSVPVEP